MEFLQSEIDKKQFPMIEIIFFKNQEIKKIVCGGFSDCLFNLFLTSFYFIFKFLFIF
jgi:hypothetical protein